MEIQLGNKFSEEAEKQENPLELEVQLTNHQEQYPQNKEIYLEIDSFISQGAYGQARTLVDILIKKCVDEGIVIEPKLKNYILSDWYKNQDNMPQGQPEVTQVQVEEPAIEPESPKEKKVYVQIPALVVGRNKDKRFLNVAWGRGQEGFFRWMKKGALPAYAEELIISFDQEEPRGIMQVSDVRLSNELSAYPEDFYREQIVQLTQNEFGQYGYDDQIIPKYLLNEYVGLTAGEEVKLCWVYKFNPKHNEHEWVLCRVRRLTVEPEVERVVETSSSNQPTNLEPREEQPAELISQVAVSLIVMSIGTPLRNHGLLCHCIGNDGALYYFRETLMPDVRRFNRLRLDAMVKQVDGLNFIVGLNRCDVAKVSDFPETMIRQTKKTLRLDSGQVFLDDEPMTARKVQILKLKRLFPKTDPAWVDVLVEEVFIYAVQNKTFEWTISSIELISPSDEVKSKEQEVQKQVPVSPKLEAVISEEKALAYKDCIAFISHVTKHEVHLIYGFERKGYILRSDFSLDEPKVGDWVMIRLHEEAQLMHEIKFSSITPYLENPQRQAECRKFYKVKEGLLGYLPEDDLFLFNMMPISKQIVRAIEQPEYKAYYRAEEILDYHDGKGAFANRLIRVDKFEQLEDPMLLEEISYPLSLRTQEAFQQAVESLGKPFVGPLLSNDKTSPEVEKSCTKEPILIKHELVSFVAQRVIARGKNAKFSSRGKKGLSSRRRN